MLEVWIVAGVVWVIEDAGDCAEGVWGDGSGG